MSLQPDNRGELTDAADLSSTDPAAVANDADAAFSMATEQGDAEVGRVVSELDALIRRGEVDRAEALVTLSDAMNGLADRYPEATDVTVRSAVVSGLSDAFRSQGWPVPETFEF